MGERRVGARAHRRVSAGRVVRADVVDEILSVVIDGLEDDDDKWTTIKLDARVRFRACVLRARASVREKNFSTERPFVTVREGLFSDFCVQKSRFAVPAKSRGPVPRYFGFFRDWKRGVSTAPQTARVVSCPPFPEKKHEVRLPI